MNSIKGFFVLELLPAMSVKNVEVLKYIQVSEYILERQQTAVKLWNNFFFLIYRMRRDRGCVCVC